MCIFSIGPMLSGADARAVLPYVPDGVCILHDTTMKYTNT